MPLLLPLVLLGPVLELVVLWPGLLLVQQFVGAVRVGLSDPAVGSVWLGLVACAVPSLAPLLWLSLVPPCPILQSRCGQGMAVSVRFPALARP